MRELTIWIIHIVFKIFTKALASRLQGVIQSIIDENQVAYIKGRSIVNHIRMIDDIINYTNVNGLPGIVMSLDYKKAFYLTDLSILVIAFPACKF